MRQGQEANGLGERYILYLEAPSAANIHPVMHSRLGCTIKSRCSLGGKGSKTCISHTFPANKQLDKDVSVHAFEVVYFLSLPIFAVAPFRKSAYPASIRTVTSGPGNNMTPSDTGDLALANAERALTFMSQFCYASLRVPPSEITAQEL